MNRNNEIVLAIASICAFVAGCDADPRPSAATVTTPPVERVCPFGLAFHVGYDGRALDRPDLSGEITVTHAPTRLEVRDSFGVQKNMREFEIVLFDHGSKLVEGGLPRDSLITITIHEHHMGVVRAEQVTLLDRYSVSLRQLLDEPMAISGVQIGVECE